MTNKYGFFLHGSIEHELILNISILPLDGTFTGTTTLGQ